MSDFVVGQRPLFEVADEIRSMARRSYKIRNAI